MAAKEPKYEIAIIIPTRNEAEHIGKTLDQLYMQDYPMARVEVVLADGGSTDRTREIAESFRQRFGSVKIVDNHRRLASTGRNIGINNSEAPYILLLDGHAHLPSKTLLRDMVDLFESTEADCLCRAQTLMPPDLGEFQRTVAMCRGSALGYRPRSKASPDYEGTVDPVRSGAMYRRTVFDQVGLFDEEFDAAEDMEFNFRVRRAGLKSYISPKLTVHHYPRLRLMSLWLQMVRYGRGRFRFSHKHNLLSPVHWAAGIGVALTALLLVLSLVSNGAASLLRNLLGLYLLTVVFFSAAQAFRHERLECLLFGPLIFPTIHYGLGVGFLLEAVERHIKKPGMKLPDLDLD